MMKKRIMALVCVLVMLTGVLASCGGAAKPKEFSKAGMTITLTEAFTEKEFDGMAAYYESKHVIVSCIKEAYADFGLSEDDLTLDEYADLTIEMNKITADVVKEDELTYFRYDKTVSGKEASYVAFLFKTSDAFWMVQFACETKLYDGNFEQFKNWAKTVKFS